MKRIHLLLSFSLLVFTHFLEAQVWTDFPDKYNPEEMHKWISQNIHPPHTDQAFKTNTGYRLQTRLQDVFNSSWHKNDSIHFTYIKERQTDEENYYRWIDSAWVHDRRRAYSWNTNDQLEKLLVQWRAGSIGLVNGEQRIWTYDSIFGLVSTDTRMTWKDSLWENASELRYFRDANGNTTSTIFLNWINGTWVNVRKEVTTWNSNNIAETFLRQLWDTTTNQWNNLIYSENVYLPNGNLDSIKSQLWENGAWRNNAINTFSYTANELLSSQISLRWDAQFSSWINSRKFGITYTPFDSVESFIYQDWDIPTNSWENDFRFIYEYDTLNNNVFWAYQYWPLNATDFENITRNYHFYEPLSNHCY